jgi:hypothetical protein
MHNPQRRCSEAMQLLLGMSCPHQAGSFQDDNPILGYPRFRHTTYDMEKVRSINAKF